MCEPLTKSLLIKTGELLNTVKGFDMERGGRVLAFQPKMGLMQRGK
jgi:hypothetical protein